MYLGLELYGLTAMMSWKPKLHSEDIRLKQFLIFLSTLRRDWKEMRTLVHFEICHSSSKIKAISAQLHH